MICWQFEWLYCLLLTCLYASAERCRRIRRHHLLRAACGPRVCPIALLRSGLEAVCSRSVVVVLVVGVGVVVLVVAVVVVAVVVVRVVVVVVVVVLAVVLAAVAAPGRAAGSVLSRGCVSHAIDSASRFVVFAAL